MRPYYADDAVTLYHGDCLDILPALAPDSVDAVITDPPYGETSLYWDVVPSDWLPLVAPILGPSGSLWCFGSLRMFMLDPVSFLDGWRLAQDVVWEKHNGSGFHADRFKRVHEHIAQFYRLTTPWADVYKKPVTTADTTKRQVRRKQRPPHTGHIDAGWYESEDGGPRLQRSVIQVRSCHGHAEHPTQKPVGILTPIIEYSCPPGGVVLDPFAGSSSVGVAAKLLGCRAVLIEREERYCEISARRLSQGVLPLHEEEAV